MNLSATSFFDFYRKWVFAHSLINISLVAVALLTSNPYPWLVSSAFSFLFFIYYLPTYLPPFPLMVGYANLITLARLLGLVLLSFVHGWFSDTFLFTAFLLVVLLDGLDGLAARKFRQTSVVGEHLDMETDAFFVLFLSWLHFSEGRLGFWILFPGALKYLYSLIFSRNTGAEEQFPTKKVRALIAVIFFVSLLLPFITAQAIYVSACFFSTSLIFLSFGLATYRRIASRFSPESEKLRF